MENIEIRIEEGKAIITIDLARRGGLSKSGKTVTVASTHGNQKIAGSDVIIGINAYVKP